MGHTKRPSSWFLFCCYYAVLLAVKVQGYPSTTLLQNNSNHHHHLHWESQYANVALPRSISTDFNLIAHENGRNNNNINNNAPIAPPEALEAISSNNDSDDVNLLGFSIDYDSDKRRAEFDSEGSPVILEGLKVKLRLFGTFKDGTLLRFSKTHACFDMINQNHEEYKLDIQTEDNSVATVVAKIPKAGEELRRVYICLKSPSSTRWKRQGEDPTGEHGLPIKPWLVIKLTTSMFPMSLHVLFIVLLLILSGLFSGLNLGLMSLDKTDLKIIMNTGSPSEKKYASSIAPVRNHGNFLLCCLLFSNVLVNATLTILVDDLTSGLIAIAGSTLAIVIFGEIIPQAICSRYGLAVGAKTIYVTKVFMVLTAPLAFPLSILLDKVLGEEIGSIYTRERLKELLKVTQAHHGLETEEVGIISGTLDLKTKTVKDVMVPLKEIFMLPVDIMLDFDTMAEIEYQGYSRIPIYDGEPSNIVALISVRQLTLLNADGNIPLRRVMDFYKQQVFFVFENTHLDFMFKAFREGSRGHMAFVQHVNDNGPGDPYYETVGMLTMEDVLEEILQADINDEADVEKIDQRTGKVQQRPPPVIPFRTDKKQKNRTEIPATLVHAATQFLSTSVEPFKEIISIHIIQRLLKTNVEFMKAPKRRGRAKITDIFLYEIGKSANYFIMILEGRVQVTVGNERLIYEAGAFSTFGTDFLLCDHLKDCLSTTRTNSEVEVSDNNEHHHHHPHPHHHQHDTNFLPDYSVKLLTDIYLLRLKHEHYHHAVAATELERVYQEDPDRGLEELQDRIDKILDRRDGDEGDDEEEEYIEETASSSTAQDNNSRRVNIPLIMRTTPTRMISNGLLINSTRLEIINSNNSRRNDDDDDGGGGGGDSSSDQDNNVINLGNNEEEEEEEEGVSVKLLPNKKKNNNISSSRPS